MQIEALQTVEENYDDLRFGNVTIYFEPEKELMVMKKILKASDKKEFDIFIKQAENRSLIDHENILKMLCIEADPDNFEISSYFEYPNEDLFEKRKNLLEKNGLKKFLLDIIESLIFLKEKKMCHGNLRPEYIFLDNENNDYVLLDRLADFLSPNSYQLNNNNIKNEFKILSTTELYNEILKENLNIEHSIYKTEIFSLGMIVLNFICGESKVQKIFDKENVKFDRELFEKICKDFKNGHDGSEEGKKIYEIVVDHMVNLDSKQILEPRNLKKALNGVDLKDIEQDNFNFNDDKIDRNEDIGIDKNDINNEGNENEGDNGDRGNNNGEEDKNDNDQEDKNDNENNNQNNTKPNNPNQNNQINNNPIIKNQNQTNHNQVNPSKPTPNGRRQQRIISWEEFQIMKQKNKKINLIVPSDNQKTRKISKQLKVPSKNLNNQRSYTPNISRKNQNDKKIRKKSITGTWVNSNFTNNINSNKNIFGHSNNNYQKQQKNNKKNNPKNFLTQNNNKIVNSGFSQTITVGGKTLVLAKVVNGRPVYRYI